MNNKNLSQEIFNDKEQKLNKMKEIFPDLIRDGEVDFQALKEELGIFDEISEEKFELKWNGKSNAKRIAQEDIVGRTLKLSRNEGIYEDVAENLYIEGNNIEVLKLLRNNYYSGIKMIYIDPPYNTGKDFVYNDDFNIDKNVMELIEGDINEDGERYTVNTKGGNRFHAKWLNMMYPLLKCARDLLRDDGIICISIDDNEVENLKIICNEIFQSENFQGHIHWRRRHNQPNDKTKMIGLVAEHILVYSKEYCSFKESGVGKIDLTGDFSNPDNDPLGEWASKPWKVGSGQSGSRYTITSPTGKVYDEEWMGEQKTYYEYLETKRIYFPKNGDGMPRKKYYKFEREEEGQCATNWWTHEMFGHNQGANDCMTELFGIKNVFSNPKPVELIRGLMQIANVKSEDIVLDFFGGSATTAHAVMNMNKEDKKNINYIIVQAPENLDASYESADTNAKKSIKVAIDYLDTIKKPHLLSEIGKQRIRLVYNKLNISDKTQGFKVLYTANTNINWIKNRDKLETIDDYMALEDFTLGSRDEDICIEILLREKNIPVSSRIEKISEIGNRIYLIAKSYLVCLEDSVDNKLVEQIALINPTPVKFVFRDSAFEDNIVLKDETIRRLEANIKKNSLNTAYSIEFI